MRYAYLSNTPLDEAVSCYLEALQQEGFVRRSRFVDVQLACGRITAKAVYARICSPFYNSCAMDGIAVRSERTFGATETTPVTLEAGSFVYVDTGDPLPAEYDCVVMVEDIVTIGDGADGSVRLYSAASPWQHVRQIGEDICQGDMLLQSFTEVTPSAAGALIAGGVFSVEVLCKPIVGIIPTGDEMVSPNLEPQVGEIFEFNSVIFSGMIEKWGAAAKTYPIVKDKPELLIKALETACAQCDIVLINAGSSAGREDYTKEAIQRTGRVILHGAAIKPGKPVILGLTNQKPVIGVPGYPVSGIMVLDAFVKPVLRLLLGQGDDAEDTVDAVLTRRVTSSLKYREFVRTRLGFIHDRLVAVPLERGAGVITSFVKADGIIDIPQNTEGYESGEKAAVRLLKPLIEIKNALIVTGSHDPLIDEAADLLRRQFPGSTVASSHVGSMGGIMAIKRGEAHIAGIHLLDEATGTYNKPYVSRYFAEGETALIVCVKRTQGFIVPHNNPKNIRNWADIAAQKLNYVNRQKGSGTRILCDYLLKQEGVHPQDILDYAREEYTHTGVAAIVAAGSADAGLGIYAAAKLYNLDFIPICDEQYDLLIDSKALDTQQVKRFLHILESDAFKQRLTQMGGYTWT